MKGQRLFVREAATEEEARTTALRLNLSQPPPAAARAWIAFLVGEPVAVAGADVEHDLARIEFLEVAERVRRKRIGTVLVREIEASLPSSIRLAVRKDLLPRAFLMRNGFVEEDTQFIRPRAAG